MNTTTPATFVLLHDGTWGVRGKDLAPGEPVVITRADGSSKLGQVGNLRWSSKDGKIVIAGLIEVSKGSVAGKSCSAILAAAGLFTVVLHGWFLLAGSRQFSTPSSLGILVGLGLVSLFQASDAFKAGKR